MANQKKESLKPTLAEDYKDSMNIVHWFMSEKLDGVRAIWDGEDFISRNGLIFNAPDWFKEPLKPLKLNLDGELYIGREMFDKTSGVVRRKDDQSGWVDIKFQVFDIMPSDDDESVICTDHTFATRYAYLESIKSLLPKHVQIVKQYGIKDVASMEAFMKEVDEGGGEGLMLKNPDSKYEHKRTKNLVKVKSFYTEDAVVIGHTKGTGRNSHRCGALMARGDDGTEFKIGSGLDDAMRDNPPPTGSVVTYQYFEKTKAGKPRFPSLVGVRDYE